MCDIEFRIDETKDNEDVIVRIRMPEHGVYFFDATRNDLVEIHAILDMYLFPEGR